MSLPPLPKELMEKLTKVDLAKMPMSEKLRLFELLRQRERAYEENRGKYYKPYPKQYEFHALGNKTDIDGSFAFPERMLIAANQVGKTWSAGNEVAYHLTGEYPDWWPGRRWKEPVRGWVGSDTSETTRDNPQRILMGPNEETWGTGAIPKSKILRITRGTGITGAVDQVLVKHVSGGVSTVKFKAYEQGRKKWQGETVHFVWCDEEPPMDIYSEAMVRRQALQGSMMVTFTPLQGMSDVVQHYIRLKSPGTAFVNMTIDDAEHYTPEERKKIVAGYRAHEREARAKGIPMMGSGRVFPVEETALQEGIFKIPHYWPRIVGLDFGWDHPTAAAWIAWNRDQDVAHIYDTYRMSEQPVVVHAATLIGKGKWIPVAWPADGNNDVSAGIAIAKQYKAQGVNMLRSHATHPPGVGKPEGSGGNSVEAGLMMMLDRMLTGKLKVASHLSDWFEEYRLYHRKDGIVVKEVDDILSASRYGLMMLRFAEMEPAIAAETIPGYGSIHS